jgi:hypothetical protein
MAQTVLYGFDGILSRAQAARFKGYVKLVVISIAHEVNVNQDIVKRLCVGSEEDRSKDRSLGNTVLQELIFRRLFADTDPLSAST